MVQYECNAALFVWKLFFYVMNHWNSLYSRPLKKNSRQNMQSSLHRKIWKKHQKQFVSHLVFDSLFYTRLKKKIVLVAILRIEDGKCGNLDESGLQITILLCYNILITYCLGHAYKTVIQAKLEVGERGGVRPLNDLICGFSFHPVLFYLFF